MSNNLTPMPRPITMAELIERDTGARQIYEKLVQLKRMELPSSMIVRTVDGQQQIEFADNPANAPIRELEAKFNELLQVALRRYQEHTP
jgi:hypothetical protein